MNKPYLYLSLLGALLIQGAARAGSNDFEEYSCVAKNRSGLVLGRFLIGPFSPPAETEDFLYQNQEDIVTGYATKDIMACTKGEENRIRYDKVETFLRIVDEYQGMHYDQENGYYFDLKWGNKFYLTGPVCEKVYEYYRTKDRVDDVIAGMVLLMYEANGSKWD